MLNSLFNTLLSADNFINSTPGGSIPAEVRNAVVMAFMILMMISAIAMIVIVLMQKGTNENVGAITGVSPSRLTAHAVRRLREITRRPTFSRRR